MNENTTKVWAPSNTGTKFHAFLGSRGAKPGNLRAACRVSTQRSVDARYVDQADAYSLCTSCVKLYTEAEDRADNSMRPATEADDLGYVAPVDERTEAAQCTCECTWKCDRPADESCTCPCVCGAEQPQVAEAPARTMNEYLAERRQATAPEGTGPKDRLSLAEHWGTVTLANGDTYAVSLKVHRKTQTTGTSGHRILADHVIYWREVHGQSRGAIKGAGSDDVAGTVAGRIWSLLVAAGIA